MANGEVAALVGPSGCGKTTLLRIIAGLDCDFQGMCGFRPRHGRNGVPGAPPAPVAHGGAERGACRAAGEHSLVEALFETLGLTAHRDHYPGELSLGLARRVALARAFAVEPGVLLLDEPFVSLDHALAARLREELAGLVNHRPVTTLLVTHDVDEAIGLADRLLLLSASPARIIADVPVTRPRAVHTQQELAAMRERIGRHVAGAGV